MPAPLRALPWSMLATVIAITALGLATLYSAAGGGHLAPWATNQAGRFTVLFAGMLVLSHVSVATWKRHA